MNEKFNVGLAIRELRTKRKLTGEMLGEKAGLSQSRISRIETGMTIKISPAEIEKILNILDAPQLIRQQICSAMDDPKLAVNDRFVITYDFSEPFDRERKTNSVRQFNFSKVPALLQIPEYRAAILSIHKFSDEEMRKVMQFTIKRQDLLWEKGRKFHFILDELSLYTKPASKSAQKAQLDRIERLIGIGNVKIGIIPYQAGLLNAEICSFSLYDERWVVRNVADGDLFSREADDVAIYLKLFGMLDQIADYGDSARMLIHKAMSFFS